MALVQASETELNDALIAINEGRRSGRPSPLEKLLVPILESEGRLAVPGARSQQRFDNHILARFAGQWGIGTMRGRIVNEGWASVMGFPALRWDPGGDPVTVSVLRTSTIGSSWSLLDSFVDAAYIRILAPCELGGGEFAVANLYEPR